MLSKLEHLMLSDWKSCFLSRTDLIHTLACMPRIKKLEFSTGPGDLGMSR